MAKRFGTIETDRLRLELVRPKHVAALLAYVQRNAAHLERWEPTRPYDGLTLPYWKRYVQGARDEERIERSYRFLAFTHSDPNTVVASINLTNIIRGAMQGCTLGYSLDRELQGKGYASEGVAAVIAFGFKTLQLHRIAANYMVENERSGALLKRLGFQIEGRAPRYLAIQGVWRDHVLTARLNESIGPDAWYQQTQR